mmetsp:Transcript_33956/g.66942  ORF Transcript_33956/g.66942 Transcript_33956/m.66942 type:complete len:241 (+) Transcript_33956:117-839(+)
MFTATIVYQICFSLLGAVSVLGECWIEPNKEGVVRIPNGTETIIEDAFDSCGDDLKAVKRMIISASVKHIGSFALYIFSGLEEVIFEKGSRLQVIGRGAFDSCKELKVVTLPPGLKEIGRAAFYETGLEKVIFEEGSELETIGDYAFEDSENLKTINIPPGVLIGLQAFTNTGCPEGIFTQGATIVDCRNPVSRNPAKTEGFRSNKNVSSSKRLTLRKTMLWTSIFSGLILYEELKILWA